jgi:pimeloyl-ACP methyl ester carboxylesterase
MPSALPCCLFLVRCPYCRARALLIYGDLDTPALIQGMTRLAQVLPNASVEVIPETGHSPQWERPELFNRALRHHLEVNAGRG